MWVSSRELLRAGGAGLLLAYLLIHNMLSCRLRVRRKRNQVSAQL